MRSLFQKKYLALILACLSLMGCASHQSQNDFNASYAADYNDPFEGVNRGVFAFNEGVDKVLINPAAKTYKAVLPQPVRTTVKNFITNLGSPLTIINALLQGDPERAKIATERFMVNTILGLGGAIDIASHEKIEPVTEDWGQTFAVWGASEGPYLVLPILGPSNLRDTLGRVATAFTDPVSIIADRSDLENLGLFTAIPEGLQARNNLDGFIKDTRENSLDPYATFRSSYRQHRKAAIANGKQDNAADEDMEYPEFDD